MVHTTGTTPILYTLPVISIPNPSGRPRFISESFEIALELEKLYTEPSLFPPGSHGLQLMFKDFNFHRVNGCFGLLFVPLIVGNLRPASVPYFLRTRQVQFGNLAELCPVGSEKREEEFKKLKDNLDTIDGMLRRNPGGGKWFMGDQISLADLGLGSEFIFVKQMGLKEDWERISQWNGGRWKALVDNLVPYMAADI